MADHPLTHEEFRSIYSRVPRLCVELVLLTAPVPQKVLLSHRAIEPFVGTWHLPGGTVQYGESLIGAVHRVAQRELGITIPWPPKLLGYIEYPSHVRAGIDSPVGVAFQIPAWMGTPHVNHEASGVDWFSAPPKGTHVDQVEFLDRLLNGKL